MQNYRFDVLPTAVEILTFHFTCRGSGGNETPHQPSNLHVFVLLLRTFCPQNADGMVSRLGALSPTQNSLSTWDSRGVAMLLIVVCDAFTEGAVVSLWIERVIAYRVSILYVVCL